jgi:hypothetical protein
MNAGNRPKVLIIIVVDGVVAGLYVGFVSSRASHHDGLGVAKIAASAPAGEVMNRSAAPAGTGQDVIGSIQALNEALNELLSAPDGQASQKILAKLRASRLRSRLSTGFGPALANLVE